MNIFKDKFNNLVKKNNSLLCVGLDSDYEKIILKTKSVYKTLIKFNFQIIESTYDLVCCYKINSAFYEAYGLDGIKALYETIKKLKNDFPVILDFKRADIGNTAKLYAKFGFEFLNADAVTIIPYMGIDTIDIFRNYKEKFVFIVAFSSNKGAKDFQEFGYKKPLYLKIMEECKKTDKNKNTGYVIGATYPEKIKELRMKGFNEIFLIPGIGAQQGDVKKSLYYATLNKSKAIFNVSRDIIYQNNKKDYFYRVREKAIYYKKLLSLE